MASSLKDWVAHKYRSVRKRGLRQAVKTADNPIRENLDVAREALRISHEILCNNSEMRNVIDETRNRGRDAIDIIEEIRRHNNETRDIIDEIRNRGRDTIDIVDEIRNRSRDTIDIVAELRRLNDAHDDRLRRLELYMLHLMKQAGIALETLSVEASDSQRPAIKGEMRFVKLEITKGSVIKNINRIRALTELQCRDADFLEHTLIPELGLAEEDWAFPPQIAHLRGKGLHLLQLPCQVAPLLAWLADNARGMESYLEIGVRWGGMFILISEWLRRFSPELRRVVALDPSEMSPLISEYSDFISKTDGHDKLEVRYIQEFSTSAAAKDMVLNLKPDFVFIDGDHRYEGVSHDYELVRGQAKMLMFHDICASNWPGVGRLWRKALEKNAGAHAAVEFTKQYPSGDGRCMGLGVIKMRASSSRPQGGDMGFASIEDAAIALRESDEAFFAALKRRIDSDFANFHEGNWDSDRFGPEPKDNELNLRSIQDCYTIIRDFDRVGYLYNILSDSLSKEILVGLFAYRILGYNKVLLPRNNESYWKSMEAIYALPKMEQLKVPCPGLFEFDLTLLDLREFGYDLKLFASFLGANLTFLQKQYELHHGNSHCKAVAGDVVIDAGGCWGDTALYFAHEVGPAGKVVSFEFIPSNLEVMRKNFSINPHLADRITVVPQPLWSTAGNVLHYVDRGPASNVSSEKIRFDGAAEGTCVTATIDQALESLGLNQCDFIKMDIEGAELASLKGAEKTIRKFRPRLAICLYHGVDDFRLIPRYIDALGLGYEFYLDHATIHLEETVLFCVPVP